MGWVSAVTWILLGVAGAVLVVAGLVSAGRLPGELPAPRTGPRPDRRRDLEAALERSGRSGIEWSEQRFQTEQIREHAHGRHEAQDR